MAAMLQVEPILQAAIWDAINNYCYVDAVFLAERLCAEVKTSDEALFLLATCYYRMGKPVQSYMLLQKRGCPTPRCRQLFAQCCVDLNKLPEAEEAIVGNMFQSRTKSLEELEVEFGSQTCYVLALLGCIYSQTERIQKAIECYRRSLKLNPFMWSAFEQLCRLGDKTEASQVFQCNSTLLSSCHVSHTINNKISAMQSPPPPDTPTETENQALQQHNLLCESRIQTPQPATPFTPNFGFLPLETPTQAPVKKPVTRRSQQGIQNNPPRAPVRKRTVKENKSPKGTGRNIKKNISLTALKDDNSAEAALIRLQQQSLGEVLKLYQDIGQCYQALSQYRCTEAIHGFRELPQCHYDTAYVLTNVGKAYFELAEYQKAERVFYEARCEEPYHLEGMEVYSTCLWHLQKDVELSTLAQELTEMDDKSPEAWIATGNCFSLQKEHDTAIKFFKRAIQVDKRYAYAYTLLGHEYVFTEELEKALSCFRSAIRVDPRHYNAWYGVGMIYYKQEKFSLAELHYRRAAMINHRSSTLLCHIGVVQHAQGKTTLALTTLNSAIDLDPNNPLCKYQRASILFATERQKEALEELEQLKQIVPKESLVYFLLGKVHKKLGNSDQALMNFSWAMELDPKGISSNDTGPD